MVLWFGFGGPEIDKLKGSVLVNQFRYILILDLKDWNSIIENGSD